MPKPWNTHMGDCLFRDGVMVQGWSPPEKPHAGPRLAGRIRLAGMHGLGDTFHERSVVRAVLRHTPDVELITSWPSVFHDMPVKCIRANSTIPYCAQNEANEEFRFAQDVPGADVLPLTYLGSELQAGHTFTSALCRRVGVEPDFDYFPVPDAWGEKVTLDIEKPILFFRPLVDRSTFHASRQRNPDRDAYEAVFDAIRDDYFVVSVADMRFGIESIVTRCKADAELHEGQLSFRQMAWLFSRSALAMSSPGMGLVMGLHVGIPTVGVFGGYEAASTYRDIAPTPFLPVEPVTPCNCFSTLHQCNKTIDIDAAIRAAKEFSNAAIRENNARKHRADGSSKSVHEPERVRDACGAG